MSNVTFTMRPWTKDDPVNLPKFDNVKLTAIATCPTFGILRYHHHKVYASPKRAMALEAGLAAHEAFASVRLADLYFNGGDWYSHGESWCRSKAILRANQLFGEGRTTSWLETLSRGEDTERSIMLGALDIFETSGYYDDPDDKRRTIANIEATLIAYVAKYPLGKTMCVVTTDIDGRPFIGVEIPIDMHLHVDTPFGSRNYHFVGRVDGVMWANRKMEKINIEDDKTASRLNDAWHESWKTSHQMTGYCAAVSATLDRDIRTGIVRGASIPLPKSYDYGGIATVPFSRSDLQYAEWLQYVMHCMDILDIYGPTPTMAPKYTHSCNRYYRPCSYVMFCDSDLDERQAMFNEMDEEIWNPLTGSHFEETDDE